jgi:uncharacterized membrane protein
MPLFLVLFALAYLGWFISPWLLVATSIIVAAIPMAAPVRLGFAAHADRG